MTLRLRECDESTIAGRFRKAEQFMQGAQTIRELADDDGDVGDAYITLCIHAGIAAADVVCCIDLGEHAQGDEHSAAVSHLTKAHPGGKDLSNSLRTLLTMKTRAGYSHQRANASDFKRAQRAAERLLQAARERRVSI